MNILLNKRIFSAMTIGDEHKAYVERVMQRTGWDQTEVARRAGLDPSTLSLFLKEVDEGRNLSAQSLRKIEQASGILFGPVPVMPRGQAKPGNGFAEAEATPYVGAGNGNGLNPAIQALLMGKNTADPWVLRSRALETMGYRIGDVLIVDLAIAPKPGDVVCAQIYDWNKGHAETLFRLYQPPCLVAATSDEKLLRPFIVDDQAVTIKGVVVASFRERLAA